MIFPQYACYLSELEKNTIMKHLSKLFKLGFFLIYRLWSSSQLIKNVYWRNRSAIHNECQLAHML